MALNVKHGQVVRAEKDFERVRVAYVCNPKGDTDTIQFVTSMLLLKRFKGSDGVPKFAGPVYAGWENLRHTYTGPLQGLDMVGALVAVPEGEFKGQIDWVKPVDGGKIMQLRQQLTADKEPAAPTHEMLKFPIDLKLFSESLIFDPVLNAELAQTSGGADMVECILRAAVRMVKEEA